MPKKFESPLTRADEIRRARGIDQPELVYRTVVNRSILSRVMNGRRPLGRESDLAKRLAKVFDCEVSDLFDPIGTPVPLRTNLKAADVTQDDALNGAGYIRRQAVLAAVLGISVDAMMRYLVYGDYALIPESLAALIRRVQNEEVPHFLLDQEIDMRGLYLDVERGITAASSGEGDGT